MKSPVPFVRAIMVMRRKGQLIAFSQLGGLLNGELIAREQFLIMERRLQQI
jgi:hypothetical protein